MCSFQSLFHTLFGMFLITSSVQSRNGKHENKRARLSHRDTLQAKITLVGRTEITDLLPEEVVFFEDAVIRTFNDLMISLENGNGISSGTGTGSTIDYDDAVDQPTMRSVVVFDSHIQEDGGDGRRQLLRGQSSGAVKVIARSLRQFMIPTSFKFDIYALFETTCNLCLSDDDDGRRVLVDTFHPTNGDEFIHQLEFSLLQELRAGPFETFRNLEDCVGEYVYQ